MVKFRGLNWPAQAATSLGAAAKRPRSSRSRARRTTMSRIQPVDPAVAKGKAKDLLDAVQKALGLVPNLYRVVAQSPAALAGLVGLNGALAQGVLGAKLRARIALGVAER